MKKSILICLFLTVYAHPVQSETLTPRDVAEFLRDAIGKGADHAVVGIVAGIVTTALTKSWDIISAQLQRERRVNVAQTVTTQTKENLEKRFRNPKAVHAGLRRAAQAYKASSEDTTFITYVHGPGGVGKTASAHHLAVQDAENMECTMDADVTIIKLQDSKKLFTETETDFSVINNPLRNASRRRLATGRRQIVIIDDAAELDGPQMVTVLDRIKEEGKGCWVQVTTNHPLETYKNQQGAIRRRFADGGIISVEEIAAPQRRQFLEQEQERLTKNAQIAAARIQSKSRRIYWEDSMPVLKWVNPKAWWDYYHITKTPEATPFTLPAEALPHLTQASEGLNFTDMERASTAVLKKHDKFADCVIEHYTKEKGAFEQSSMHTQEQMRAQRLHQQYIRRAYQKKIENHKTKLEEKLEEEQAAAAQRAEHAFVMLPALEEWKAYQAEQCARAQKVSPEAATGRHGISNSQKIKWSYFGKGNTFQPYLHTTDRSGNIHFAGPNRTAEEEHQPPLVGLSDYQHEHVNRAATVIQTRWRAKAERLAARDA